MASGVATVAFDYGAAREHLRNGTRGAAVANDRDFAAAAVRIGTHDAQRRAMGAAARRAMEALRPEQVAADFQAILADLASTRRPYESAATA